MGTNQPKPTPEQVLAEMTKKIAELEKANAALKATKAGQQRVTIAVSSKGGVSVYGLGRFPITLYLGQWQKLFSMIPELQTFVGEAAAAGALATDKDQAFVQPNNLPLKFKAKVAAADKRTAAL